MQNYVNLSPPVRISLIAIGMIAIIMALHFMAGIVAPFLLAILFSVLFWAMLEWLKRRGLPSWAAIGVVILSLAVCAFGMGTLLSVALNDLTQKLPALEAQFPQQLASLGHSFGFAGALPASDASTAANQTINPTNAIHYAVDGLSVFISNLFLIVFYVIFMVMEAETLRTKLRAAFSDRPSTVEYADGVTANIRRYIVVQSLLSVLVGILVWLSLSLLRIEYAVIWGVLAFLLNFVPNFGPILAAIPAVLTAFIQYGSSVQVLLVIAAYTLIVIVVGSFIFPRVMGKSIGLSPLVVLVSLIFWGWVLGPIGLVLSVPITATIKIILDAYAHSRWAAILLGNAPTE